MVPLFILIFILLNLILLVFILVLIFIVDKDRDKDQEQEQQQEQQQEPNQQEQQQQAAPREISKVDAERMLQAIQQQEKDVKEKVDKKKAAAAKVKTEKDW